VHSNGQIPLERHKRVCRGLGRKHFDMSRWFASATFMICVHDFPRAEVSVKVSVMESGLIRAEAELSIIGQS